MNVHIHSFQPGGAVADEERSSSSRNNGRPIRSWSIPTLSHKEVGRILHDTLKAIAEPLAFLDIAGGDAGQMKKALAGTKVDHYHGIDLSEPALELAANNLEGVPFVVELDHRDFVAAIERRPEPADAAWCGLSPDLRRKRGPCRPTPRLARREAPAARPQGKRGTIGLR